MMRKIIFSGLIICCLACSNNANNAKVEVSDEEVLFNMTIDSLKNYSVFSNVFGKFNFDVRSDVLNRALWYLDTTLTDREMDSISVAYYYNCSRSIHDLINEKNAEHIVYRFSEQNVNILGYPIILDSNKAVTINYHHKYLRPKVFELYSIVLVFEKNDGFWEIADKLILIIDE